MPARRRGQDLDDRDLGLQRGEEAGELAADHAAAAPRSCSRAPTRARGCRSRSAPRGGPCRSPAGPTARCRRTRPGGRTRSGSSLTTTASPSTRPSPRTTLTPLRLAAPSTPCRILRTTSSLRLHHLGKSNETSGTTRPYSSARRTRRSRSAVARSALVGMHPQLRHVPPSSARSIIVTSAPQLRCAQRGDVAGWTTAQHDDPRWARSSLLLVWTSARRRAAAPARPGGPADTPRWGSRGALDRRNSKDTPSGRRSLEVLPDELPRAHVRAAPPGPRSPAQVRIGGQQLA